MPVTPEQFVALSQRPKRPPQCCICINVRAGTLALSIFQILIHLTILTAFLVFYLHPALKHQLFYHLHHDMEDKLANDMIMDSDGFDWERHHHHHHHPHPHPPNPPTGSPEPANRMEMMEDSHPVDWITLTEQRALVVDEKDPNKKPQILISRIFSFSPRNILPHEEGGVDSGSADGGQMSPIVVAAASSDPNAPPLMPEDASTGDKFTSHRGCSSLRHFMGLAFSFSFGVSCLLCFGVLTKRPLYILPYLALQIVDLALICLRISDYTSYLPHAKLWLSHQYHVPFKTHLMQMNETALMFLLMGVALGFLAMKIFLIGMVWDCFRHIVTELRLKRLASSYRPPVPDCDMLDLDCEKKQALLPVYEECVKMPIDSFMPPHYEEASNVEAPAKEVV